MGNELILPVVGPWAEDKLDRLRKYLVAYTQIMKGQSWAKGYIYVDAFAGAGRARLRSRPADGEGGDDVLFGLNDFRQDEDVQPLIDGSPRIALNIPHPFTRYVFIERDESRLLNLRNLTQEYGQTRDIHVHDADCNGFLQQRLMVTSAETWKKWRAVVFLDPFGMQVPWTTIEGLARTQAVEVFINFPVGMAIQRLLLRSGDFTQKQRDRLDAYFGSPGWYDAVYRRDTDLFGDTLIEKPGSSGARLVRWYCDQLRKLFGFVAEPALVRNTRGGHLYYLLFAGPNETGAKIATYVLRGGSRKLD